MPTLTLVKDAARDLMATKEGSSRKSDVDIKKSNIFCDTTHFRELSTRMMDGSQQLKLHLNVII